MNGRRVGALLGPALLILFVITSPPEGLSIEAWRTVGLGLLLAVWWSTEPIPIPATSLLPLVVAPLIGIADIEKVAPTYAGPVTFLLLGGFLIATAFQHCGLHRRWALFVLRALGSSTAGLTAGFMLSTALLSMWISNTACTLLMAPIALSVATTVAGEDPRGRRLSVGLLFAVMYGANIGGIATLIGTPPNAILAGFLRSTYAMDLSFIQWFGYGLPVVAILLPVTWWVLARWLFRYDSANIAVVQEMVREERASAGPITRPETRVGIVFGLTALAWAFRPLLQEIAGLHGISDAVIAMSGGLVLFLLPAGSSDPRYRGGPILNWETAVQLPWGILLLFGGGMTLAALVVDTGLAEWLGSQLAGLQSVDLRAIMAISVVGTLLMTELVSNTGTTSVVLPILGSVAVASSANPLFLAAPAAMAASCAFMLPVATAPNAIVYATGQIKISEMIRTGVVVNALAATVIILVAIALLPRSV